MSAVESVVVVAEFVVVTEQLVVAVASAQPGKIPAQIITNIDLMAGLLMS